ncbi:hypothetical protein [Chondrinema litorale]|uniref:hypothetical protein n=1 Tax=Chondrinema litorale TaxID=2994555 RepID=UPI002543C74C|nr:hypothetical protein [Chondrinema litorale]UZR98511.1 hypothetical protein OQ292_31385 [Chondrinema litorale]
MIIISLLMLCVGFFAIYNTSKKIALGQSIVEKWLQQHQLVAKLISLTSFIFSISYYTNVFGFGAGVFFILVAIMSVASLMILLIPIFKKLQKKNNSLS